MDAKNIVKTVGTGPITKQNLVDSGVTRYWLQKWLDDGQIEKVGHGLYKFVLDSSNENPFDEQFCNATAVAGRKSAICLLSALEYHHLTDIITKTTWVMVPFEKRVKHKDITVFRTRNPHWSVGILRQKGYRITSLERTLIDCLLHKNKVALSVTMESLKLALKKKRTSLSALHDVAKRLHVLSRLKPIFDVLI